MRTRQLREMAVSIVGSGDTCLARSAARGVDHVALERALKQSIELGVTLVEATDGDGGYARDGADSEKLVGEVVRAARAEDRVIVATRVPVAESVTVLVKAVQARVEASLRNTGLSALPLAQLPLRPAWTASTAWPELVGTCARLVQQGKVLRWGAIVNAGEAAEAAAPGEVTTEGDEEESRAQRGIGLAGGAFDLDLLAAIARAKPSSSGMLVSLSDVIAPAGSQPVPAAAPPSLLGRMMQPWLCSMQLPMSLCDLRGLAAIDAARDIGRAGEAGAGLLVLVARPLAGGALAGSLGVGAALRPTDDRIALEPAQLEQIAIGLARLSAFTHQVPAAARSCKASRDRLEVVKTERDVVAQNVAELAMRFAIDRSGGVVLPRLHRHDTLPDTLAVALAPALPRDLLDRLASLDN